MNNENTKIYIRVSGKRPEGFIDPKPFEWGFKRDKILWTRISKMESLEDMDWKELCQDLGAPESFLKKRSYMLFQKHLKLLSEQMSDSPRMRSPLDTRNSVDETILQNLQASKILNNRFDVPNNETLDTTTNKNNEESGSDLSSSLSVSKSALEDALMDRLQL